MLIHLNSEDINLSNKVFSLISEVRKEVGKKYKIPKPISDMHWDEKIDKLPPEAWMMEQVLSMLEKFMERQTGRSRSSQTKVAGTPGRHGVKMIKIKP
jgi:hypothetical protein